MPTFPPLLRDFRSGFCALAFLIAMAPAFASAGEQKPTPIAVGYTPLHIPNACLPDSLGFRSAYEVYQRRRGDNAWSRVLLVYLKDGSAVRAHAYCVFTVAGKLWTYDQVGGSQRAWVAPAEKGDATKIGRLLAARNFVRATWADTVL